MTEDLTDGAFALLDLLAIPVLVPVALGLAAWRFLRRPKPWVGKTVAPTAHRGAELGKLAEDHRKGRTIKNGELYLAARARKAQEDDRCDARAMEAVQAMAPPDPAAAEQGEREGVPRRDRGAGGQAMTPEERAGKTMALDRAASHARYFAKNSRTARSILVAILGEKHPSPKEGGKP